MERRFDQSVVRGFVWVFVVGNLLLTTPLYARTEDVPKEPIWVMSWATFIAFIALTIFFFSRSYKRPESILSNDERKQVEGEMIDKVKRDKKKKRDDAKVVKKRPGGH